MDRAEIIKYKDRLLNNLMLRGEYEAAAGLRKKVLLVEGATDKAFATHILREDTDCLAVVEFMKSNDVFRTSKPSKSDNYNSKSVITMILKHIALFPEFIDFPKGAEEWPLFGLVDKDYDERKTYSRITKLFLTDTHDLETLMLSTDLELLLRLQDCKISHDEIKAALYISVQLAAFRKAMINVGTINPTLINEFDGTVDYSAFTDGDKVSLLKLLHHVNAKADKPLSKARLKKTQESITKEMKRQLDKEGNWKKPLESFEVDEDSSFWEDINGHDVLSAVCYKNSNAKQLFTNKKGYSQNRDFEFALSESYDYGCFKKTELYKELITAELLKNYEREQNKYQERRTLV